MFFSMLLRCKAVSPDLTPVTKHFYVWAKDEASARLLSARVASERGWHGAELVSHPAAHQAPEFYTNAQLHSIVGLPDDVYLEECEIRGIAPARSTLSS